MNPAAPSAEQSRQTSKTSAQTSSTAANKKSPAGAAPGQPKSTATSKKALPPNASQSNTAIMANGGSAVDSVANGKHITPAVPALGPTIVNGNNEHSRSPSFTVGSHGVSGAGSQGKTNNIQFGSVNTGSSPAAAAPANLASPSPNNLGVTGQMNPRQTSPQTSPSPIPQPATASGGRPPSSLQGQGNGVSFGNFDPNNQNGQSRGMQQNSLGPGPQHLRRESSQSSHSDMGNQNMPAGAGRGFTPMQGGRGRGGSFQGGYPNASGYQQNNPAHRPSPNSRGSSNMGPGGYYGGRQGYPGSPSLAARSPAMNPATPNMGQMQMANPGMQGQYGQFPPHMAQQGYGMPSPYDPQSQMYGYNAQYMPQMGYMPPQSPRPPYGMPQGAQPPYMQHQYSNQGPSQQAPSMSRTSSQMSAAAERPSSSLGQPQTPSVAQSQPGRNTASPAPKAASAFTLPAKKSSAIVIKDPNSGMVINNFAKPPASPARATPPPVKTATPPVPTPPSRSVSQAETAAPAATTPTPAVSSKTDEEKKNEMRDAVARKLAEEQAAIKREAEQKASKEKDDAAAKAKEAEEESARLKAEAEAKTKAAEEAKAKEAKEAEDKKAKEAEDAKAKEAEKAAEEKNAEPAKADEDEIDYDAIEAEFAAQEAEEAAREAEYQKKKQAAKEEQQRKEAEEAKAYEENMKQAEREAEAAEEAREKKRAEREAAESGKDIASSTAGQDDESPEDPDVSGAATPASDAAMPPPSKGAAASKREKPVPLKLETAKPVEPPQATPAMKSLQSATKITDLSAINYPSGTVSPNPAVNENAPADRKFHYDKEFLLQFQSVFKEKPSVDWDIRVRDTLGEGSDTPGRSASARTPSTMGGRSGSNRPGGVPSFSMGTFNAPPTTRPVGPGSTSEERFARSNAAARGAGPAPNNPFSQFGRPVGMPVGGPQMSRGGSNVGGGLSSPRNAGPRGSTRGGSKRGGNTKKEEEMAKSMPLTAGLDLKPIAVTSTGWKPRSVGQGLSGPGLTPDTHLAPDVVQRKVKSNLNKMTPENFDKISNQILEIAAQSKDETDGRTLRQVIQLTFEKATDEAHWAPMYAKFAKRMLESMSNDVKDENIKDRNGSVVAGGNLFRKYLLNRCQEEFERGWKVNLPEKPEGVTEEAALMSEEYYIAAAAKRRGLGLVKFIGELFKLGMLTERIMHECLKKLLDYGDTPDEAEVESLTGLLRTIGAQLDLNSTLEKGPQMMEVYFQRIQKAMELPDLPSRLRFMLLDIIDLRKQRWHSKDDAKGPKTIQEIHEEAQRAALKAEQDRLQSQANRGGPRAPMGRGDARNFSGGYGQMPPPDTSNRLGTDDLRRLGNRAARSERNPSGPAAMGPGGMFSSGRTGSGRRTLGPGGLRAGDESGASSRTGTPPAQKKEESDNTSKNAFSALAALDGDQLATSPPSTAAPAIERTRSKSPSKESST